MEIYLSKPGVMSCAGNNIDEVWQSVTEGNQKGIKKYKACNGEEYYAARIDDKGLKPSGARYDMKVMRIENAALEQIAADVDAVKKLYGPDRIAVCVGSCDNGTEFSVAAHRKFFTEGEFPADYNLEIQGADYAATFVAEKFGITGPANCFSTACSSSAGAIIKAAEMIKAGLVDAAIAGGIDIASDTTLVGFGALEAVSSEITNPFSRNRHGITLGDGAGFFVLTREPLPVVEPVETTLSPSGLTRRSIRLLGWGESADAYHMTSPDPSGAGAEKAIRRALESAGLATRDVGYINLHGTGTKFNDSMEAKAVAAIFGEAREAVNAGAGDDGGANAASVPVSTTKPVTGHTLGAAAALEAAICWKALVENSGKNDNIKLPVQVWDGERDEELPTLNIVDGKSCRGGEAAAGTGGELKVCLSNSFAFGGANACLALGI